METVNFTSSAAPSAARREASILGSAFDGEAARLANKSPEGNSVSSTANANSAVEKFKNLVQELHRNLDFSVDDSSGQVVVKVIDGESGKLIRQIPSEDLLRLSERLEDMRSLLFKAEA